MPATLRHSSGSWNLTTLPGSRKRRKGDSSFRWNDGWRVRLFLALLVLAPAPAAAQTVSTSPGPKSVSVTVYRDRDRDADRQMDLRWLNGYALITEQRVVEVSAGEGEIRFEGVAGGIIPESAIVTGLPEGVVEKNQDAYLLSPASLLDASLGRRVHIRRTSRDTGRVTETEAVIRSGADGAVVLETPAGIEALRCTGIPETPIYDRVPTGLSAKPTLSVRTRSRARSRATITLSYLATGFDWQANYIAELSADGRHMDLFAWLTLANGDETSFVRADTQAVAGRLEGEDDGEGVEPEGPPLNLQCWPQGTTTSDLREFQPPPPPPPPAAPTMDLEVTGSRVYSPNLESASPITSIMAEQVNLGDLKLYRIPEPVTVAAMSQKQVALLSHDRVPVDIVYRYSAWSGGVVAMVTTRNRSEERLGIPLPSGEVVFFQTLGGRRVLVGEGHLADRAVGEEVEIEASRSSDVQAEQVIEDQGQGTRRFRLTVTNAKPYPIRFEAEFSGQVADMLPASEDLANRDGHPLWQVTVPANGSATLRFTVRG
jgi:hypothetical protein